MSWIIIPKADVSLYRKKKITWFYGIDPVELKDGNFALPERVINDHVYGMKRFPVKNRVVILPNSLSSTYDKELEKYPIEEKPEFKPSPIDISYG